MNPAPDLFPPTRPRRHLSWTAAVAVLVLAAGAVALLLVLALDDGRDDEAAKAKCEDLITERIATPATATFSDGEHTTITGDGDDYTVRGYVDAENPFGATIRNQYTCELRYEGGDRWTALSVEADPI